VPDWERYCKVTDTVWDGVFWLKVDSGAAYNFSICDETNAQVGANTDIDQLLAQPGMDRRCLSDEPYHEANVGVYADTTKGDLAAAKQFCQAHGWSNF
jgi:hypothetical protein